MDHRAVLDTLAVVAVVVALDYLVRLVQDEIEFAQAVHEDLEMLS